MNNPPDTELTLSPTLSLREYQSPKDENCGFWLYDSSLDVNLAMRATSERKALVAGLAYYQKRLAMVEQAHAAVKPNTLQKPTLHIGETYIGVIDNTEGEIHHVILLPGESDEAPWYQQMLWAKLRGGDLPSRTEHAMMLAGCRDQFKETVYWSNQTDNTSLSRAWWQYYYNAGSEGSHPKSAQYRACTVRRVPISGRNTNSYELLNEKVAP